MKAFFLQDSKCLQKYTEVPLIYVPFLQRCHVHLWKVNVKLTTSSSLKSCKYTRRTDQTAQQRGLARFLPLRTEPGGASYGRALPRRFLRIMHIFKIHR